VEDLGKDGKIILKWISDWDRGSAVSVVTTLRADGRDSIPGRGWPLPNRLWGPPSLPSSG